MSNTFEGVRLFTGVFTAKFEGDYIPADSVEAYLNGWLESGLSDRDDLRGWNLSHGTVVEAPQDLLEIVWRGLINANNGVGTHEDIQAALESAGYGCPESLEEYGS